MMKKNKHIIFFVLLTILTFSLFAQTGVSLEAEIQNMERTAERQGITPVERHAALVQLARLRQLSGDIEGAAKNWLEAAGAIPGQVDDDALLACAYCLAAMGEWYRARTALQPLLGKSLRARFLDIAISSISTGDVTALAVIVDNPEFSELKNEILFMLWRISHDINRNDPASEIWRQRLVAEFPHSVEGRLAAGGTSSAVVIKPSPFWFFLNGLDSLPLMESEPSPAARPAAVSEPPAAQTPVVQPPVVQTPAPSGPRLQTGIFSRQNNAQAQVTNLSQAGFTASIEQRGDMWAVTVPAGADANRTIRELRTAGFESFPIR